ncbi:hypothetical protein [Nocardia carnea]|uniref:hypothetical protein n=1 Tax=Nocardia carnea TaxID=37328 RepID=UPI0024590278|nr:hypothetical protein [Nocardia carnea]
MTEIPPPFSRVVKGIGIVAVSFLSISIAACGGSGGEDSGSDPATTLAKPHPDCDPRPMSGHPDPDVEQFVKQLHLGDDISIESAQLVPATTLPGEYVLSITACVPHSTDGDSLRPVATDIAHKLIKTELGKKVHTFSVIDYSSSSGIEATLRTKEFNDQPWDGTPSPELELAAWEVFS